MSDTTTTYAGALKEFYSSDKVNELLTKQNPLNKLVKTEAQANGLDYYRTPIVFAPGGATSSDFAKGMTAAKANSIGVKDFHVDRVSTYAFGYIDDILLQAAKGSAASFIEASKLTVEHVIYQLGRDIAIAQYRDGWGTRGKVLSFSSKVITLTNKSDVLNFEYGDRLVCNANKGDAAKAVGSSTNPLIVTGRDEDAGTLTFGYNVDDATNGIPTIAISDFLYKDGDCGTAKTKLTGLAGWLPTTRPTTSDSFFGVNRSIDSRKLAGAVIDGSSMSIVEAFNQAAIRVAQAGGNVDRIMCSFGNYKNLVNSLEGKVRISDHRKDHEIGFPSLEVITPVGVANVVADVNCPDDTSYALQTSSWKLYTLGADAVHQIGSSGGDGLSMRASYNSDQWELRYRFTGGFACSAPGWNAAIIMPT
jgi:hypothetical protein